jgi:hypothetical protein
VNNPKAEETILGVIELLGPKGENWQQGAKDNHRFDVYCALVHVDHELHGGHAINPYGLRAVLDAAHFSAISELIRWNDFEGRTFFEISRLLQTALRLVREE